MARQQLQQLLQLLQQPLNEQQQQLCLLLLQLPRRGITAASSILQQDLYPFMATPKDRKQTGNAAAAVLLPLLLLLLPLGILLLPLACNCCRLFFGAIVAAILMAAGLCCRCFAAAVLLPLLNPTAVAKFAAASCYLAAAVAAAFDTSTCSNRCCC